VIDSGDGEYTLDVLFDPYASTEADTDEGNVDRDILL